MVQHLVDAGLSDGMLALRDVWCDVGVKSVARQGGFVQAEAFIFLHNFII